MIHSSSTAFKRNVAQRLSSISNITSPTLTNCRISSPSSFKTLVPQNPTKSVAPDPGDDGFFRRFLQRRSIFQPAAMPEARPVPIGTGLVEKLRAMDIARDRLRLDALIPPAESSGSEGITVEDARKLLRVSQLEAVKSRLREVPKSWISHEEYVQICSDACSSTDQGLGFAKMLDESGTVIVLGSVVCLRPHQVVKAIEGVIGSPSVAADTPSLDPEDPRRKELEEMEKKKAAIDRKAESLVRKELWAGLGFFVVQTLGFMRLTFWELSWDVMEPICFYVTSGYCMAGYAFFLRTAREPSFEGFFQSRLGAKQKRLMRAHNFDMGKYKELLEACKPRVPAAAASVSFDKSEKMKFLHHHS